MVAGDRLAKWMVNPKSMLPDARVAHFWDEEKAAGRFFEENVTKLSEPGDDRIEWDAYFLYRPGESWRDGPPKEVVWGRTIVDTREQLVEELETLLRELATAESK